MTNVSKTRSCNYSLEAPDDERQYRSKHVEQSRNNRIINFPTQLHLVGHFYKIFLECLFPPIQSFNVCSVYLEFPRN
jgi:hypothetical protein